MRSLIYQFVSMLLIVPNASLKVLHRISISTKQNVINNKHLLNHRYSALFSTDSTDSATPEVKIEKPKKAPKEKKEKPVIAETNITITNEEIRQVRINKLTTLQDTHNINPFAYTFNWTHKANELQEKYIALPNGEEDSTEVVNIAGRIMIRRVFGKLAFFQLQDESGSIQIYIEKGRLGDKFDVIKDLTDAGDIVGM